MLNYLIIFTIIIPENLNQIDVGPFSYKVLSINLIINHIIKLKRAIMNQYKILVVIISDILGFMRSTFISCETSQIIFHLNYILYVDVT
jgi:methyl coenzyme M reductase subunit C